MSNITFTQYFKLSKDKYDFYDTKVYNDSKQFLDPTMISSDRSDRSKRCSEMIREYFGAILKELKKGQSGINNAAHILKLQEHNDFHLGYSKEKSCGNAIGIKIATRIANSIFYSKANQSGLIEDIEDASIFVRNVGYDRISDLISNIIAEEMIDYTEEVCIEVGLEKHLVERLSLVYDPVTQKMIKKPKKRLVIIDEDDNTKEKCLILVPSIYLNPEFMYNSQKYIRYGIVPHFILSMKPILDIKTKKMAIQKIIEKYELKKIDKEFVINYTIEHPEVKEIFKREIKQKARESIYKSKNRKD